MDALWCEAWGDVRRGLNQQRLTQELEQFRSTENRGRGSLCVWPTRGRMLRGGRANDGGGVKETLVLNSLMGAARPEAGGGGVELGRNL